MISENLFKQLLNTSYAFIIGGLIIVVLTVGTKNYDAVIGTICGYSVACCATIVLAALTYTNIINGNMKPRWITILYTLVPFIILFLIFALSLALLSIYFDQISNNRVNHYYSSFSMLSVIFILMQTYIIYSATKQKSFQENGGISVVNISKLLLISVINIIIITTLGITLKYFSTDG